MSVRVTRYVYKSLIVNITRLSPRRDWPAACVTEPRSRIILPEGNVREPALVNPIVVSQRKMDIAKQENVSRYPGMIGHQRIRPHLVPNCLRGDKLLKTGRLNVPWHIMRPPPPPPPPPNMIHAVLWRTLPCHTQ